MAKNKKIILVMSLTAVLVAVAFIIDYRSSNNYKLTVDLIEPIFIIK